MSIEITGYSIPNKISFGIFPIEPLQDFASLLHGHFQKLLDLFHLSIILHMSQKCKPNIPLLQIQRLVEMLIWELWNGTSQMDITKYSKVKIVMKSFSNTLCCAKI